MRPTFHPRLVNGPWGDPALLVRLLGMRRSIFFDLGDLHPLPAKPILRATHCFVSHAHMDHFCGFDTVVRYQLGRERTVRVVGPPGIADRVEGKLNGYTWNLVGSYGFGFELEVLEWTASGGHIWRFSCREGFPRMDGGAVALPAVNGGLRVVHREPAFRVTAAALDHQVPSLAFALEEPLHVNVARDALDRLGLPTGPWIAPLKLAVLRGDPAETPIGLPDGDSAPLGHFLERGVIRTSVGQKLAYIADCGWSGPAMIRARALAAGAHVLYCEAAFLHADAERARARHHLTAAQAGELARLAGVGELRVFHFSPRYQGREEQLLAEAAEAFGGPVTIGP